MPESEWLSLTDTFPKGQLDYLSMNYSLGSYIFYKDFSGKQMPFYFFLTTFRVLSISLIVVALPYTSMVFYPLFLLGIVILGYTKTSKEEGFLVRGLRSTVTTGEKFKNLNNICTLYSVHNLIVYNFSWWALPCWERLPNLLVIDKHNSLGSCRNQRKPENHTDIHYLRRSEKRKCLQ